MTPIAQDATGTIRDIALETAKINGDASEARDAMLQWIRANPAQLKATGKLADDALATLCDLLIQEARHRINKEITGVSDHYGAKAAENGASVPNRSAGSTAAAIKASSNFLLLSMAGKQLGSCTRDDLLEDSMANRRNSLGSLRKAIFQESVAAGLSGRKTVKTQYTNSQLEALWRAADETARQKLGLKEKEAA